MNRLHDLLPRIIEDLDEEHLVGVLGLDNWGYITIRKIGYTNEGIWIEG